MIMNDESMRRIGVPKGLIAHLTGTRPLPALDFRVRRAEYWRNSPIAERNIIALWECGVVLTYFDVDSATYRQCSLESIDEVFFEHRSIQGVLAELFVVLWEDEMPDDELLALARDAGFVHAERLLRSMPDPSRHSDVLGSPSFADSCDET